MSDLSEVITSEEFYRIASLVGCEPEDEQRHRKQLSDLVAGLLERAYKEGYTAAEYDHVKITVRMVERATVEAKIYELKKIYEWVDEDIGTKDLLDHVNSELATLKAQEGKQDG